MNLAGEALGYLEACDGGLRAPEGGVLACGGPIAERADANLA
jgi:hypothetical protein